MRGSVSLEGLNVSFEDYVPNLIDENVDDLVSFVVELFCTESEVQNG